MAASIGAEEFPALAERAYLNTAAEGLGSRAMAAALQRYAEAKARGARGRETLYEEEARARAGLAALLGARTEHLALLSSTSEALNTVLWGLPWQAGDNVVVTDLEFPTGLIAARHLGQRLGVEVRMTRHHEGIVPVDDLAAKIDARTRLVLLSHVSYRSGYRFDLAAVARAAHAHGALVLVDAAQSLGVVPVDVGTADVDFVVAPSFKWLIGSHGLAVLYCRPDRLDGLHPPYAGWRSVGDYFAAARTLELDWRADAQRLESGMLNYESIFALNAGLGLLDASGPAEVAARALALSARMIAGLRRLGIRPLTPDEAAQRAGIVAFETERYDAVGKALAAAGVDTWYREGRVRASAHFYNTEAHVDAYLRTLEAVL